MFLKEVVKILDDAVKGELHRLNVAEGGYTGMEAKELEDLIKWNVLRNLEKGERYVEVCRLFKVPKEPGFSRLIMNAKATNARFHGSPRNFHWRAQRKYAAKSRK